MESVQADISDLEQQLAQRDELVQALTAQLEQAAEKLDRVQRSGGVLSNSSLGTSPAAQQLHQQISQDVGYLAEQWETTQLPGTLGRIEIQLQEIRDLLAQSERSATEKSTTENATFAAGLQAHLRKQQVEEEIEGVNSPESLELIRSLRDALGTSDQQISIPDRELDLETGELKTTCDEQESGERPGFPSAADLPELPAAIEETCEDLKQWQAAVTARDAVIAELFEKYRKLFQQKRYELPTDEAGWPELPESVAAVLQPLQQQLESQLRINEVSMSLERARLGREATRLETVKIDLQKELKQQGINSRILSDLGLETSAKPAEAEKSGQGRTQRWLSMLKIKDE